MNNLFTLFLIALIVLTFGNSKAFAQEFSARSSAALVKNPTQKTPDSRAKILKEFLEQYDSPLAPNASDFVEIADKYELDWKLVAAISGVESTFGKQIAYESFNGWGWGIYGDNMIKFSSWKEGIETVSEGLRTNYINKWGAENVYEIGRIYAASPTWASRVTYFMDKIEEFENKNQVNNLSISL